MCKGELPLAEFNRKSGSKDGFQPQCKKCTSAYFAGYYKTNKEKHKKATRKRKKRHQEFVRLKVSEIKQAHKCLICSEGEACCLGFHHVDPKEKLFPIAEAVGRYGMSWRRIVIEIEKCVCLCHNCHAKIHAEIICREFTKDDLVKV
jgi:hypothetical protein